MATLRIFGIRRKTQKLKKTEDEYIIGEAKTGPTGKPHLKKKKNLKFILTQLFK